MRVIFLIRKFSCALVRTRVSVARECLACPSLWAESVRIPERRVLTSSAYDYFMVERIPFGLRVWIFFHIVFFGFSLKVEPFPRPFSDWGKNHGFSMYSFPIEPRF